jgi:hypothetical protein
MVAAQGLHPVRTVNNARDEPVLSKTRRSSVEVNIGVQNASRELTVDSDQSSDEVEQLVAKALSSDERMLVLSDTKGRKVIVPTDKLAYVEVGSPTIGQVGFRS